MEFISPWTCCIATFLLGTILAASVFTLSDRCAGRPEHVLIPCKGTFEKTRSALEEIIPPLNYGYRAHLRSGNYKPALALEALRALPRFNNFTSEPRDFGRLLDVTGRPGVKAVQYQIGNPLTATSMVRYEVEAGLFLPVTVLLRADAGGTVAFRYVRPRSMMGRFRHPALCEAVDQLDGDLLDILSQIAGWDRPGQWNEPKQWR